MSVPPEAREEFYRSYVSYCNKATKDSLEKKGLNSITEKAKTVNQFYIDLDFKIEHFAQGLVTIENVGTLMNTIKNMFLTVLQEALGKIDLYCVTAFRGMYKCHLYFPNIPLTGNQSEQICRDVETRLSSQYPWIVEKKIIDTYYFTSGLRMIYSHKGRMAKPSTDEKRSEEEETVISLDHLFLTSTFIESVKYPKRDG